MIIKTDQCALKKTLNKSIKFVILICNNQNLHLWKQYLDREKKNRKKKYTKEKKIENNYISWPHNNDVTRLQVYKQNIF